MLENVPPGQAATRIMPNANSGSICNAQVARQVPAGNSKNCATRPTMGALGSRAIRLKSAVRSDSDTPNIINARITLSAIRLAGLKLIGLPMSPPFVIEGLFLLLRIQQQHSPTQQPAILGNQRPVTVLVDIVGHARHLQVLITAIFTM